LACIENSQIYVCETENEKDAFITESAISVFRHHRHWNNGLRNVPLYNNDSQAFTQLSHQSTFSEPPRDILTSDQQQVIMTVTCLGDVTRSSSSTFKVD